MSDLFDGFTQQELDELLAIPALSDLNSPEMPAAPNQPVRANTVTEKTDRFGAMNQGQVFNFIDEQRNCQENITRRSLIQNFPSSPK